MEQQHPNDAVNQTVPGPDELSLLTCTLCHQRLKWVEQPSPAHLGLAMDVTAEADCCGRKYSAYSTGIRVYSERWDGN